MLAGQEEDIVSAQSWKRADVADRRRVDVPDMGRSLT